MNDERWLHLVERLEARAQSDPKGYRRKVIRFAALGYAYIALALAFVLALAVVVVYVGIHHGLILKLLLPIGALVLLILRSLAVRIEPPDGVPLTRAEAPALYDAIDEVSRAVRGPSLHAVLLDGDNNAGIVQVPRFAIFGSRNYLVLGLPLLQALTPAEFRAVLAHEFAHLSRRHGRLGVWLYRIRATWQQLLFSLEQKESAATGLFRHFFEWYVPRFNAHTFPLMRVHEFEADRLAADAVGSEALGHALGRVAIADEFLTTRYWPAVFGRAHDEATPREAYTQLAEGIRHAAADEDAAQWLDAALQVQLDATDSHPGLAQRLEALGLKQDALQARDTEQDRAADMFLGDSAVAIAKRLDARWQRDVARAWATEHTRVQTERAELWALEERGATLDVDEQLTLAELTSEHRSPAEALTRYREILAAHPDHALARFSVGRLLLEQGDDAGLAELDRALDLDPDAILPGCALASAFLMERGRKEDAARYQELGSQRARQLGDAYAERESFTLDDPVEPAELEPDVEHELRQQLTVFPDVMRAYVARRRLEHLADEQPAYVLFVVAGKAKRQEGQPSLASRLAESIELPGNFHVLVRRNRSGDVKRFEEKVPEPVYRRR